MVLGVTISVVVAGVAAALLALAHVAVPAIRRHDRLPEPVTASVGGGVAVAYVFLHLLPELAEGNEEVAELLGESVDSRPIVDIGLFMLALSGFLVLYGLDHLAARQSSEQRAASAVFHVHLGAFSLYNAVVGYTLPTTFRVSAGLGILFALAMALHFILTDRHLDEHYTERFRRRGRLVLAGSVMVGWVLALVAAPPNVATVNIVTALLAGFILFNAFADELPSERRVRYPTFLGSVAVYATLLIAVTALAP